MKNVQKLLTDHSRLIESEAAKYGQYVPLPVVRAEAWKLATKAANEFDEKKGVKFSTFLVNSLKKLSRISTKFGGAVRIPEGMQFKINRLNAIEAELSDILGREPSALELAEHTGWPLALINNLKTYRKKEVNIANIDSTPIFSSGVDEDWVHFVYHDLGDRDKLVFEWKTGFAGKPILSNDEIAKKLKISPSTVEHRVQMISHKLSEGLKG